MCTEKRNFTNFSFLQKISGLGEKKDSKLTTNKMTIHLQLSTVISYIFFHWR